MSFLSLRDLGRRVAETQADELGERQEPTAEERVLALHVADRTRIEARGRQRTRKAIIATALACLGFTLAVPKVRELGERSQALRFEIGGASSRVGAWMATSSGKTESVNFSDGSRVVLASESSIRVIATSPHGATLALDRGGVHADVVHTGASEWNVLAGPFTIHVTGTRFDAAWNVTTGRLAVQMNEGRVVVSSPCLPDTPLERSEQHDFVCPDDVGVTPPAIASEEKPAPEPAREEPKAPPAPEQVAAPPPPPHEPGVAAPPIAVVVAPDDGGARPTALDDLRAPAIALAGDPWRESARQGRFKEALTLAEGADFVATCAKLDASDLLLLGDSARFAGSSARANAAYRELRRRFAADEAAATASFHLGRMAMDSGRPDDAAAQEHFETYLREAPQGALAAEALGRLLELYARRGQHEAAKEAARSYLARYPNGPHAHRAHEVLAP
jgi:hypothetical protein